MASRTLPAFPLSEFPQVFTALLDHEIREIERIVASVRERAALPLCSYQSPESSYGACDGGFPCQEPGVVHHLEEMK
jgi:hypothetical protein